MRITRPRAEVPSGALTRINLVPAARWCLFCATKSAFLAGSSTSRATLETGMLSPNKRERRKKKKKKLRSLKHSLRCKKGSAQITREHAFVDQTCSRHQNAVTRKDGHVRRNLKDVSGNKIQRGVGVPLPKEKTNNDASQASQFNFRRILRQKNAYTRCQPEFQHHRRTWPSHEVARDSGSHEKREFMSTRDSIKRKDKSGSHLPSINQR